MEKWSKRGGSNKKKKIVERKLTPADEVMKLNLGYEFLAIKDVEDDQDSIFRAVCDQVYGNEKDFLGVKERVLEFIGNYGELADGMRNRSGKSIVQEQWRKEARAAGFVFQKCVRVFISGGPIVLETYPSDDWIHLCLYKSGTFGSVRFHNDINDQVPQKFFTFCETDQERKDRKERTKEFADYFIENFGIGTKKNITWVLMRLFPLLITYDAIDDSYEKILYYLEKQ